MINYQASDIVITNVKTIEMNKILIIIIMGNTKQIVVEFTLKTIADKLELIETLTANKSDLERLQREVMIAVNDNKRENNEELRNKRIIECLKRYNDKVDEFMKID